MPVQKPAPLTAETLLDAQQTLNDYAAQYAAAHEYRNILVRRALAEGWTLQRISDVTGLTRGRVSQIKNAH